MTPADTGGAAARTARVPGSGAATAAAIDPLARQHYRYRDWTRLFRESYEPALVPGAQVLDVGSGRRPTIDPAARPEGTNYVGLDVSAAELRTAPAGSYDETFVANVEVFVPELEGRFDLIVSWQVLEHVRDMTAALEALHRYLRPGGRMVLEFTGKWSIPGVLGRVMPRRLGRWGLVHLVRREPEGIFPAYFDRCSATELRAILTRLGDTDALVVPRYASAGYLRAIPPLQRAWMSAMRRLARTGRDDLASYYLVVATRRRAAEAAVGP